MISTFITPFRKKKFYAALIQKNALCFDIGANHGTKSKLFLSIGANVIAFEPQTSCFAALSDLENQSSDFRFYPFAVGSKNERRQLRLANHDEVATLSDAFVDYFTCDTIYWNGTETVEVKSLDALIAEFGLPDFCKIDTEGYEFEILSNLHHPIPMIEFEFTGGFIEETLKIITLLDNETTRFNYVLNENLKFKLTDWISGKEMETVFKSLPKEKLHGNIFVRNEHV
jgi:FkbM family methyltransferase